MKKILFICHGNICRSPMAEYCFRDIVHRHGCSDRFEVASAATSSEELGNPVYPLAKKKLAEHGIDCSGKTSRRIHYDDYSYYDMIVCMDSLNLRMIAPFVKGDPDRKVSLLLDHTPPTDTHHHLRNVEDPWYSRDFDAAWDDISTGCNALFEKLCAAEGIQH